jgi:hypothetical protein
MNNIVVLHACQEVVKKSIVQHFSLIKLVNYVFTLKLKQVPVLDYEFATIKNDDINNVCCQL